VTVGFSGEGLGAVLRKVLPARLRESFGARLVAGVMLTTMIMAVVQFALTESTVEARLLDGYRDRQAESVRSIQTAVAGVAESLDEGEDPVDEALEEAGEVLDFIGGQHGIEHVHLVDRDGVVVASHPAEHIGETVRTAAVLDVLSVPATRYAGDLGTHSGDLAQLVAAVELPFGRYALVQEQELSALQQQRAEAREQSLLLVGLGLVVGLPCFYLLFGRRLQRQHRLLQEAARRDGLTGLLNHRSFQDGIRKAVERQQPYGHALVLALVDIDDFKAVNDSFGHQRGDSVITALATLLSARWGRDNVFRLGGDEFAVLLDGTTERLLAADADALRATVQAELPSVTVSVGVASHTPGTSAALMNEQADAALYEAKQLGRNRVVEFAAVSRTDALITPEQVAATRKLIAEGDMEVVFQPIWDLDHAHALGYEALARPAEHYGLDGPLQAFDIAERIGHVVELDTMCRIRALGASHQLPPDALLFVNLNPRALEQDDDLPTNLLQAALAAGRLPSSIVLEITERTSAHVPTLSRVARKLRELGFLLALDDVGEGNSGLELLAALPVDFIKISREVVSTAMERKEARAVLNAVLAFAQQTDAYVIAEGIETPEMLDLVRNPDRRRATRSHGVGGAQGYLLGRPAPALDATGVPPDVLQATLETPVGV
jgi:diguanylate cyclase (GGDEF)-like protein